MITDEYFYAVANSLSVDELSILGYLYDNDSTITFKAIPNKIIYQKINMSKTKYFAHLNKLSNINFIEFVSGTRKSKVYLTKFGIMAIQNVIEREEVEC